jgi:uncharacterized phage-associated protein
MYSIGKRKLSTLLGWGELTFTRYYDGYLPTKQYSEILKKLYDDPTFYYSVLEAGKGFIQESTYKKSKLKLQELLAVEPTPIMNIASYLRKTKNDLSSYRLQKLLYYVQGVSSAFKSKPLFLDSCEAWANGPVYKDVYYKYREKRIDDTFSELLYADEKAFVDCVVAIFGRYDGDTLVDFTHNETPWIEARGTLPPNEPSNNIITLDSIVKYFAEIRKKYEMNTASDMKMYARDMLEKLQASSL